MENRCLRAKRLAVVKPKAGKLLIPIERYRLADYLFKCELGWLLPRKNCPLDFWRKKGELRAGPDIAIRTFLLGADLVQGDAFAQSGRGTMCQCQRSDECLIWVRYVLTSDQFGLHTATPECEGRLDVECVVDTYRSITLKGWPMLAWNPVWEPSATVMITRWPRQ